MPRRGSRVVLRVLASLAAATVLVAQGLAQQAPTADLRARCSELVAFWLRHGGSKGEGGGSGGDMVRKSAEVDCAAGRYESGIRAMEELLRRNGYTMPGPTGGR